jgi:hypothetical protein
LEERVFKAFYAFYSVVIVLAAGACAHHPPAQSSPQSHIVRTRIVYADSATIDSLRRAHPPDSATQALNTRYDSLVALVDTIIILSPDSIVLHVGQAMEDLGVVQVQSRRASGEPLLGIGHDLEIEDRSIADHREGGLQGLKIGRTRLVITVISRKAHAPPSYLPVIVIP